jgi:type IV pilus assembly protein PilM
MGWFSWLSRFFSGNYLVPALDIGTYSLKLLQLEKKGRSYKVKKKGKKEYKDRIFAGTELLDEYSLVEHIKELYRELQIKDKEVVIHIPLYMSFYNVISVPVSKKPEEAVVEYMKGILTPEELSNVKLTYKVLPVSIKKGNMDIAIAAVRRGYVEHRIKILSSAGLNPVVIDIEPAALNNQYYLNNPANLATPVCIVGIGASFTKIVVSFGGYPYVTRNIEIGGNLITEELQKEFMLSKKEAEKLKRGEEVNNISYSEAFKVISSVLRRAFTEVMWTIDTFRERFDLEVSSIKLYGGSSKIKGITEFFNEISNIEVTLGAPLSFAGVSDSEEFAVAAGLSIRYKGDENAKV